MEEMNLKVYRTENYDMFKPLQGNREISPSRISKIISSINEVGYIMNPIIVNENMEIIDGQGRLEALKILRMPVDYIVQNGIGIKECVAMNIYQTNWTLNDYINSYAAKGNQNYIRLKELLKKYPEYNCYVVATALKGTTKIGNVYFKSGNFNITDEEYEEGIKRLEYLKRFDGLFKDCKGKKQYIYQALIYCYTFEDVDNERMVNKMIELSHTMGGFGNLNTCLEEIEKIYNKSRNQGYSFIVTDYRRSMMQRMNRGALKMNYNN